MNGEYDQGFHQGPFICVARLPVRFVPTRVHGIADWLLGALLVALPFLHGVDRGEPEGWLPMALGQRVSS